MSIDIHTWASSCIKLVDLGRVCIVEGDIFGIVVISSVDNNIWLPVVDSCDGWTKVDFDIVKTDDNLPWKNKTHKITTTKY